MQEQEFHCIMVGGKPERFKALCFKFMPFKMNGRKETDWRTIKVFLVGYDSQDLCYSGTREENHRQADKLCCVTQLVPSTFSDVPATIQSQ